MAFNTNPTPDRRPPNLLVVSNDQIGEKMAGSGMRYLEMSRALSGDVNVTLATPHEPTLTLPGVRMVAYEMDRPASLRAHLEGQDVVLISGYAIDKFRFLQQAAPRLVIDLYDPFLIENLFYYTHETPSVQETFHRRSLQFTNLLARCGDFFLCGNERQRDFWLGVLAANGRINPATFRQDATFESLIGVVGVGFPDRPPRARPYLRGVHPAFSDRSQIVLWGGGIWDWLDPLTVIESWPRVIRAHPEARLVFLGTRHPNPNVPRHRKAAQAEERAAALGEKDRSIFFIDWLPYEDREALLCEANVGVSMHPLHLETRFSIRTRVIDYFWARLPVLVSDGDVVADWVKQWGLGEVVKPMDAAETAAALDRLLAAPKERWQTGFDAVQKTFAWTAQVAPLRDYCLRGAPAADRAERGNRLKAAQGADGSGFQTILSRAAYLYRAEGARSVLRKALRALRARMP